MKYSSVNAYKGFTFQITSVFKYSEDFQKEPCNILALMNMELFFSLLNGKYKDTHLSNTVDVAISQQLFL